MSADKCRVCRVDVRMTKREKKMLDEVARDLGISQSDVVRTLVCAKHRELRPADEIRANLAKQGWRE